MAGVVLNDLEGGIRPTVPVRLLEGGVAVGVVVAFFLLVGV